MYSCFAHILFRFERRYNRRVSVRMEKRIYDKLTRFCEDAGQSKTVAVERAVEMYIDDYYEKMGIIGEGE